MSAAGLSRRALLGGGLARIRARVDEQAPPPPVSPTARWRAAARAFWEAGDDPRFAAWCAPVAPVLLDALDLPTLADGAPRVLDAGAGSGALAGAAAARGARACAVDLAVAVARRGAERTGAAVDWHVGDVAALPLGDDAFDAVTSAFGVVYAADMRPATQELRRVLRPGGRLALATWDSAGAMGVILRAARQADPARFGRTRPERWGSYDGLVLALDRFDGFDVEPRELTFAAPDRDGLWAALTAAPAPLSGGEVARAPVEAGLEPFLRETAGGVELRAAWTLVTAQG